MIETISVTNYLGENFEFELAFPEKSGFAITKVDGLSPGKATINMDEAATTDGNRFNSARISSRNIVLTIRLLDGYGYSIEELRKTLYRCFSLKRELTLRIKSETRYVEIQGYVETNEITIFTKTSTATISIICPDPFFYSSGENGTVYTSFSGVAPEFEFVFSNESLAEKKIEIGRIENSMERVITYDGDASVGIKISIHVVGKAEIGNINIYNVLTREFMTIDVAKVATFTGGKITIGDDIIINTSKGKKSIRLIRAGETYNILNCINRDASWFQLSQGDNIFAYTVDSESGSSSLQFIIENRIVYEGI